jgi:hypothetical protein
MPSRTIHQFLAQLDQLRLSCRTFVEDSTLIITVTSSDFTEGEWEHEEQGDRLIEPGQGWELEIGRDFTVEDLLNGIDDGESFSFQPCLTYHSIIYYWPYSGRLDRALSLPEIEQLLAVLTAGEFPYDFLDADSGI